MSEKLLSAEEIVEAEQRIEFYAEENYFTLPFDIPTLHRFLATARAYHRLAADLEHLRADAGPDSCAALVEQHRRLRGFVEAIYDERAEWYANNGMPDIAARVANWVALGISDSGYIDAIEDAARRVLAEGEGNQPTKGEGDEA